jgi:ribonuclease HI
MAKKSKKYYVVWEGVTPGIYESWTECQLQIAGFPNAKYKSFKTKEQALAAYNSTYDENIERKESKVTAWDESVIVKNSIAVDAACSGNPGDMEYRGVDTYSADEIFRVGPLKKGTNNVGEFLALVHALAYLKKLDKEDVLIYTDSKIAMGWVKKKKAKTKLAQSSINKPIFMLISRAETWLANNTYKNPIAKWETKLWGEIPADFGRK